MAYTIAPSGKPTIRACLFDMDGLLIDSEDIYTYCTNQVLHKYGKPDLPWTVKARIQGRPDPAASRILHEWAQLPISMEEFQRETSVWRDTEFSRTQPLIGVEALLTSLKGSSAKMAVATSSQRKNFEIKTRHLDQLFKLFDHDNVVVGDDPRIAAGRGKPLPDIYWLALQTINDQLPADQKIHPEECLVFEDSVPGVEAGRRAGMQVAWVPHPGLLEVYADQQHEVLAGRTGAHVESDSDESKATRAELARKREEWIAAGREFARVPEEIGQLEDGWGKMYHSLENFPFDYYGIKTQ